MEDWKAVLAEAFPASTTAVLEPLRMSAHALATVEAKGFPLEVVEAVWRDPEAKYPSYRYPGQHKRIGKGICLCCDDATGKVITVFVHQENTRLRPDQLGDADAVRWARRNELRVG